MGGALAGMGEQRLPIVSAVTGYDHETEGPILIGHGQVAWDDRPEQTECLINSHSLRQNTVTVDDVTMRYSGKQKITISGTEVKLDFVDEKTLSFNIRKPTKNELQSLKIHWLCPKQRNPFEENNRTPRNHRAPADYVKTPHPGKTDSHAHQILSPQRHSKTRHNYVRRRWKWTTENLHARIGRSD